MIDARLGRWVVPADLSHKGNIFNILRIVFASAVIFSHAYVLTGHADPSEAALPFSISHLAVLLFFTLSGFLVTNSLQQRGVIQFAIARGLRMIPGLWVMLIVTALAAILLFNRLPPDALLGSESFRDFLWTNAFFVGRHYHIDGVLADNPLRGVMNGSLWTIPREVQCYVALALVGAVGLLTRKRLLLAMFGAGVLAHLFWPAGFLPFLDPLRPLAISFFAGVLLFLFRDRVFLSWPLALVAIALTFLTVSGPLKELATQLTAAYVILVLGILVPAGWKAFSSKMPDYSFGVYIYAFFVQQVLIATGLATTPVANMMATLVLTLPLAALSWHFIEKPALALKDRGKRNRPAPAA
jgi:peptidoglycan/LPS O-acetylase OafA/YrhL